MKLSLQSWRAELREGFVSLGSAGDTLGTHSWLGGHSDNVPAELLVLTVPLCFDFQALWGWQQLLQWQRGKKGSDLTCLSPTPPSGRGSRHVCSGEHSPGPATLVPPASSAGLCGHSKSPSSGIFFGSAFLEPESCVLKG